MPDGEWSVKESLPQLLILLRQRWLEGKYRDEPDPDMYLRWRVSQLFPEAMPTRLTEPPRHGPGAEGVADDILGKAAPKGGVPPPTPPPLVGEFGEVPIGAELEEAPVTDVEAVEEGRKAILEALKAAATPGPPPEEAPLTPEGYVEGLLAEMGKEEEAKAEAPIERGEFPDWVLAAIQSIIGQSPEEWTPSMLWAFAADMEKQIREAYTLYRMTEKEPVSLQEFVKTFPLPMPSRLLLANLASKALSNFRQEVDVDTIQIVAKDIGLNIGQDPGAVLFSWQERAQREMEQEGIPYDPSAVMRRVQEYAVTELMDFQLRLREMWSRGDWDAINDQLLKHEPMSSVLPPILLPPFAPQVGGAEGLVISPLVSWAESQRSFAEGRKGEYDPAQSYTRAEEELFAEGVLPPIPPGQEDPATGKVSTLTDAEYQRLLQQYRWRVTARAQEDARRWLTEELPAALTEEEIVAEAQRRAAQPLGEFGGVETPFGQALAEVRAEQAALSKERAMGPGALSEEEISAEAKRRVAETTIGEFGEKPIGWGLPEALQEVRAEQLALVEKWGAGLPPLLTEEEIRAEAQRRQFIGGGEFGDLSPLEQALEDIKGEQRELIERLRQRARGMPGMPSEVFYAPQAAWARIKSPARYARPGAVTREQAEAFYPRFLEEQFAGLPAGMMQDLQRFFPTMWERYERRLEPSQAFEDWLSRVPSALWKQAFPAVPKVKRVRFIY